MRGGEEGSEEKEPSKDSPKDREMIRGEEGGAFNRVTTKRQAETETGKER